MQKMHTSMLTSACWWGMAAVWGVHAMLWACTFVQQNSVICVVSKVE